MSKQTQATPARTDHQYRTTVGELIAELQEFPPETLVCVDGYEGGIGPAGRPKMWRAALDTSDKWYYGPHDDAGDQYHDKSKPVVDVVVIPR